MKKVSKLVVLSLLSIGLFTTSCEKENTDLIEDDASIEVSEEIKAKLTSLAFNPSDVQVTDFVLPDGSTEKRYLVEGDIALSKEYIETMELNGGVTSEQYRTNNLVSAPRTLRVIGYTGGGGFGLSQSGRTGLQWAINNYNRENLELNFQLDFGTNYQSYDIVVYNNPNQSGSGGSAGFPSNGNPNKFVQIYGLSGSSNNVNEHVIAHEIGHSVGFRHTDYFSRQSCGQNVNEGQAGVGAVRIPGTPAGFDPGSIMLACFSNSTDGEWNNNDIIALNFLY
ncbi:M57 family metalloprotease [Spongiivirga citrea]|uniref:Peptidase n=1 Tax=Spongiivirga citrea TaxID=1481457 RepID=A0A6M0CIH4_9FLAO|nr:M57 family metalloprotease [Spongiivirga citrea]NER17322.1 peptidase [Spongiivirga citrea]